MGGSSQLDGDVSTLSEWIFNNGPANIDIEYNWLIDTPANPIAQFTGGNITMKYNLFEDTGQYPSNHVNYQQLSYRSASPSWSSTLQFNTTLIHNFGGAGGEGFQFYANGSSGGAILTGADVGYNTMIALNTNPNAVARQNSTAYSMGQTLTVPGSTQSFFQVCAGSAWTSSPGCQGGNGSSTCTTASTLPSAYSTIASRTNVTDGTCITQGQSYVISYLMHGSNDSSGFQTKMSPGPATMHDNFLDLSGSLNGGTTCGSDSFFYPGVWGTTNGPSGTVAWTAPSNNFDMNTGLSACATYP